MRVFDKGMSLYCTEFFSMFKSNFKRNDDKEVKRLGNLSSIGSFLKFMQVLSFCNCFSNHRMNNDSEMNHRGYQSNSEDVTSRNKQSDVLKKYEGMDGAKRRQAIEAFGACRGDRTELWCRKDLTCRIFVVFIYQSLTITDRSFLSCIVCFLATRYLYKLACIPKLIM